MQVPSLSVPGAPRGAPDSSSGSFRTRSSRCLPCPRPRADPGQADGGAATARAPARSDLAARRDRDRRDRAVREPRRHHEARPGRDRPDAERAECDARDRIQPRDRRHRAHAGGGADDAADERREGRLPRVACNARPASGTAMRRRGSVRGASATSHSSIASPTWSRTAGRSGLRSSSERASSRAARGALTQEFERADVGYGADASRSRTVATIGTVVAIVFLLVPSRSRSSTPSARRRSHIDATTDALTGLGNRRKLFADMAGLVASVGAARPCRRHLRPRRLQGVQRHVRPPGRRCPARPRRRAPRQAVAGRGGHTASAATSSSSSRRPRRRGRPGRGTGRAHEEGAGFSIGCSRGSTRILAGVTLEQALHEADQRLYAKALAPPRGRTEARDALLQVLAEQTRTSSPHLGHVAALAASTAIGLG